mgnify:CR=1 FL=1
MKPDAKRRPPGATRPQNGEVFVQEMSLTVNPTPESPQSAADAHNALRRALGLDNALVGSLPPDARELLLEHVQIWGDPEEALALAELDGAGGQGEQGVVATDANVLAGVELGAALADDDGACVHGAAAEDLDAQALGVGITTVAAGALSLLVCHNDTSPRDVRSTVNCCLEAG